MAAYASYGNSPLAVACGHDVHASTLLAAAKCLVDIQDSIAGTIYLCFQIAEENMGSDDFSFMTVGVPACYVQIGAQSTLEGTSSNHHNTKFFLDEKGFLPVVEFFTQYVVDNYTE